MAREVAVNCDMGEAYGLWELGDDDALMSLISMANVACGFHAGDPPTMRRVCATAAERGVVIGAHEHRERRRARLRHLRDEDPNSVRESALQVLQRAER